MNFDLTLEEANLVMQGLGEMPYRLSSALVDKMRQQAQPQLAEAQAQAATAHAAANPTEPVSE
jgi:hypothetical protein